MRLRIVCKSAYVIYTCVDTEKHGGRRSRRGCRKTRKKIVRVKNFKEKRDSCTKRIDGPSKTRVSEPCIVEYRDSLFHFNSILPVCTESEGKTNTPNEGNSTHEVYDPEVYDWRPSVEKTDVMRTMEAIEGYFYHFTLFSGAYIALVR